MLVSDRTRNMRHNLPFEIGDLPAYACGLASLFLPTSPFHSGSSSVLLEISELSDLMRTEMASLHRSRAREMSGRAGRKCYVIIAT